MAKKIIILYFLFLTFIKLGYSEKRNIFNGYFLNKKMNVLAIHIGKEISVYKNDKWIKVSKSFLKKNGFKGLEVLIYENHKIFLNKYNSIRQIKDLCHYSISIEGKDSYIVAVDSELLYGLSDLYAFNGNKLKKINMGEVHPFGFESIMYYDVETNYLYFSGYKLQFKKGKYYDFGIYAYNTKTKKVILFDKNEYNNDSLNPYKIPGINKISFIKIINDDYHKVIIKDKLK